MDDEQRFPLSEPFVGWFQPAPPSGFRWVTGNCNPNAIERGWLGYPGPWLVPVEPAEATQRARRDWFDALGHHQRSRWHRKFANLAIDKDEVRLRAIRRFANNYGWLDPRDGVPAGRRVELFCHREGPQGISQDVVRGEALVQWDEAIFEVAGLAKLWDLIRTGNEARLRSFVRHIHPKVAAVGYALKGGALVDYSAEDAHGRVMRYVEHDDPRGRSSDEVVAPARTFLARSITRALAGEVLPEVTIEPKFELTFAPTTLRAAFYLHLMHEISGRRRLHRTCANPRCGKRFAPKHENQQYCEGNCRKRAFYHRQ